MEPSVGPVQLTPKIAAVLRIFLEDPERERYGAELMRVTGQPSGTLYPILSKLEKAGWIVGGKEDIDPHVVGRPARRNYRMVGTAVAVARTQLAALSELYRPPVPVRARLAPNGGTR